MSRLRIDRESRRHAATACTALILITAGVSPSACSGALETANPETTSHHEPAKLEPIKGTDVTLVKFSAEGAKKTGLQTAVIRRDGEQKAIPYAAVLYDTEGNTFTYTSPERLTFVRKGIKIERVDGDRAVLSEGPPAGTKIVTTGAEEVYGAEFEVEAE